MLRLATYLVIMDFWKIKKLRNSFYQQEYRNRYCLNEINKDLRIQFRIPINSKQLWLGQHWVLFLISIPRFSPEMETVCTITINHLLNSSTSLSYSSMSPFSRSDSERGIKTSSVREKCTCYFICLLNTCSKSFLPNTHMYCCDREIRYSTNLPIDEWQSAQWQRSDRAIC